MNDEITPRSGSGADLARRMDRMEARQDSIETEVRTLAATVARVELNQEHATELNKLRFDALDTGLKALTGIVTDFIKRVEGIVDGTVETGQGRAGREMVADYQSWRRDVDNDREDQAVLNGQVRLLGRLAVLLVSTNVLAVVVAAYALVKP